MEELERGFLTNEQLDSLQTLETRSLTPEIIATQDFSQQYERLSILIKQLDDIKKRVDSEIKEIVQEHFLLTGNQSLVTDGYKYTYIPESIRESVDIKKLKQENPELYKKYVKISNVSGSMRATKLAPEKEVIVDVSGTEQR